MTNAERHVPNTEVNIMSQSGCELSTLSDFSFGYQMEDNSKHWLKEGGMDIIIHQLLKTHGMNRGLINIKNSGGTLPNTIRTYYCRKTKKCDSSS